MKTLSVCAAAVALIAGSASASVLLDYDSNTGITNQNQAQWNPFSSDPNLSANPVTRGPGLTLPTSSTAKRFAAAGFDTSATLNTALNCYFTFGFAVPTANSVTVTDIRYVGARSTTSPANGPGPLTAELFWTTDAGATLNAIGSSYATTNGLGIQAFTGLNIAVSGGQTVEFRIYAWSAGGAGGEFRLLDDNVATDPKAISIGGTSVPTPGAMGVVGVGLLVIARRKR